jgi:hypothetical protein
MRGTQHDESILEFRISKDNGVEIVGPIGSNYVGIFTDRYSVSLSDTADNPQALSNALYAVIDGGTRIIQRRILRLLYSRIGIELPFAITSNFEHKVFNAKKEYEKA